MGSALDPSSKEFRHLTGWWFFIQVFFSVFSVVVFNTPVEDGTYYVKQPWRAAGGGGVQHVVQTLIQIVLIQSSPDLVRSCIWMISRSSSNMGHAGSKTRSQGHLVHFKHSACCPDSNSNSINQIFTKPGQKLYLDHI